MSLRSPHENSIHVLRSSHSSCSGSPPGEALQDGRTYAYWDPLDGLVDGSVKVAPGITSVDSFCSSGCLLPSGKFLASGGHGLAVRLTSREAVYLDYETEEATQSYDMKLLRWYGTMTKLPDGRVMTTGGGEAYAQGTYEGFEDGPYGDISTTPEIFTEGKGWELMPDAKSDDAFGAKYNRWWYPRQWVSPTGSIFGVSAEKIWELSVNNGADATIRTIRDFKTRANDDTRPNIGATSTAVMYAHGMILQVGGNGYANHYKSPSSEQATIFDIRDIGNGNIYVTETTPMANPRQWANAAVLPTGIVAVTGGSTKGNEAGYGEDVRVVELWDPETQQWKTGPEAAVYRGYHSSVVLLPSGALLVSGGGVPGPYTNYNSQVYLPPYMFQKQGSRSIKASRPRILRMSSNSLNYNDILLLKTSTLDIKEVSCIALPSVTHSFDSNQRRLELRFKTLDNGIVEVTLPKNGIEAPPGYYFVSIVDLDGFPSPAVIISVAAVAPPLPRSPPPFCPSQHRTDNLLDSCVEQEKCFSLSYRKVDDSNGECQDSKCNFQWEVCIKANKENPCCAKRMKKRPKRAFSRACIRGNKIDSCLDDGISLGDVEHTKNINFDDEICEYVRPGENATFQLVSILKELRRIPILFYF